MYIDASWLVLMAVLDIWLAWITYNASQIQKNVSVISPKTHTNVYLNSASCRTIYCCVMIHQGQYINTSITLFATQVEAIANSSPPPSATAGYLDWPVQLLWIYNNQQQHLLVVGFNYDFYNG